MQVESVAVLRWIASSVLADGEDAVVAVLEDALRSAVAGNGLTPSGHMLVRQVGPEEYPEAQAARPDDDPGAILHLAEVEVQAPDRA